MEEAKKYTLEDLKNPDSPFHKVIHEAFAAECRAFWDDADALLHQLRASMLAMEEAFAFANVRPVAVPWDKFLEPFAVMAQSVAEFEERRSHTLAEYRKRQPLF